jgi:hypothetical protein
VVADFAGVQIQEIGPDVVEIKKAQGAAATNSYKVSLAYRDGFTASGTLVIYGPNAAAKAQTCGAMVLQRLQRAGVTLEQTSIECLGAGSVVPCHPLRDDLTEVVLRVSVRDPRRSAVERFTRELAPLVTSGPPGVTGYTTGRAAVREVFAYWPALLDKAAVSAQVELF